MTAPLRAAAARPGDVLARRLLPARAAIAATTRRSGARCASASRRALREDGEALVEVAERGLCHAARDVSMPGVAGSLLQLLELAGCGATLDVDAPAAPRRASRSSAGC